MHHSKGKPSLFGIVCRGVMIRLSVGIQTDKRRHKKSEGKNTGDDQKKSFTDFISKQRALVVGYPGSPVV